jgi:thiamine pyrophosphate-dependent acetolactate synthase large subunit-like protein
MKDNAKKPVLDRRAAVAEILKRRNGAMVVAGLGAPCWDTAAAGDDPLNFYTWGGMGGAAMVGLGLAIAQPKRRVLIITGDGEILMGLGALATIGVQQPRNLAVVVMDNEHYGETGMQATHTRLGVDLAGVAKAAGFRDAGTLYDSAEVRKWSTRLCTEPGPLFAAIKVTTDRAPLVLPRRDGTALKHRFREALLGPEKAYE